MVPTLKKMVACLKRGDVQENNYNTSEAFSVLIPTKTAEFGSSKAISLC